MSLLSFLQNQKPKTPSWGATPDYSTPSIYGAQQAGIPTPSATDPVVAGAELPDLTGSLFDQFQSVTGA